MRSFRLVLFILSLASLLATAQEASQPVPLQTASAQSKVSVYIYRSKQFVGSVLAPSVYCDETPLARMENGRYFTVRIDPGNHVFRSNDAQSGVALDLKAGQEYFVRVEIATGLLKGHGRLTLTSPEQGRYELKSNKLKPLDSDKVADQAHVSVEEAKFDTPLPPPATVATPQVRTPAPTVSTSLPTEQRPVSGVTLSDSPLGTDPQMSVGEAARQARQKKAANNAAPAPQ
jgi:hypothetical protein